MNEEKTDEVSEEGPRYDALAADVNAAVSKAVKTVEFGTRGFRIAVTVFVLIIGLLLPWVDGEVGLQVLLGGEEAIPRLFSATAIGFGVIASTLALVTRRWWLTWVCAVGGWFSFVDGLLAIWSQQSSSISGAVGNGPGLGLIISAVAVTVLAAQWMRVAWSRQ